MLAVSDKLQEEDWQLPGHFTDDFADLQEFCETMAEAIEAIIQRGAGMSEDQKQNKGWRSSYSDLEPKIVDLDRAAAIAFLLAQQAGDMDELLLFAVSHNSTIWWQSQNRLSAGGFHRGRWGVIAMSEIIMKRNEFDELRAEIDRLQVAKRAALAIADLRAKEAVALRLENERLWAQLAERQS